MNEPEEKPVLNMERAVATLSQHREEWKLILDFLDDEKSRFQADFRQADGPNEVMKLAGSIATVEELRQYLTPNSW